MKKFKIFSLVLLGGVFGLASCDAPAFLYKIPGLNKLLPEKQESQKEEKQDEESKPSDDQGGQQGGEQGGEGHQGGGGEGQGEGGGGNQQAGEGATFDFSVLNNTSGSQKSYSFTTALGTNSNNTQPAYNADKAELRLYIGNTITITGTANITSILFTANTCGEAKADGTLAADKGTLNEFSWSGSATEVTFSVNSGKQVHISKIDINGGGEVEITLLDEFPLAEVQAAIEEGTTESFPIPEGEGFLFELDEDYENSCYVTVYGGSYTDYLATLDEAGFAVEDSYLESSGLYYADSEGGTLEISLEPGDEAYILNYYAVEPMLDEFPKDQVDAYLEENSITETYPIPVGDSFTATLDEQFGTFDINVVGGSSADYMAALETDGFTKSDAYYSVAGCYAFTKGGLEIDVYPWDVDYEATYYLISFMPVE